MPLNNQSLVQQTTIYDLLQALKDTINYNMNCVKVATVISFDPAKMSVRCRINNKRLRQLKKDGNQVLEDYPDIYAKVHFYGWGGIGSIYPIEPGMEGILLFNDRELQTWYMTSDGGKLAYDRCHDLTDALFICGVHSQPKIPLVPYLEECLHIYYKGSDIQIRDESIITNTKENTLNAEDKNTINTKENTLNAEDSDTTNTKDSELNCTNMTINSTTNTVTSTTSNINSTNINTTGVISQTGNVTIAGTTQSTVLQDLTAASGKLIDSYGKIIAEVVDGIVRVIY